MKRFRTFRLALSVLLFASFLGCVSTTTGTATTTPSTGTTSGTTTPWFAKEIENGSFETGNLSGWTVLSGNAFFRTGITSEDTVDGTVPYGKDGDYCFGVFIESLTGILSSSVFTVSGSGILTFRMGAGQNPGLTYLSLVDAGTGVELARYGNSAWNETDYAVDPAGYRVDNLVPYYADLSAFLGEEVRLLAVDLSTANGGYLTLDAFQAYHPTAPDTAGMVLALDIKPVFPDAAETPSSPENGDFASGTLSGWTAVGETGCFQDSHLNGDHRLSNRPDETKVGLLRSSAFRVAGTGLVSFRLGATKHPDLTYLSVKKVGTNEEVFRTWSDRWKDSDEENTHLYWLDLSEYLGECLYLELVDNSRADWGLLTFEDLDTFHEALPSGLTDEVAVNLLETRIANPDFAEMRNAVNAMIAGISDETERLTFQKSFYATLDGVINSKGSWGSVLSYETDGSVFVLTGDIEAMWLRDSSAQVLPYLRFLGEDEDVRLLVKGLLKKQFEFIRRDPYANAFNRNGSVFERKFELDSLCYPVWLAWEYQEATGDDSLFDAFFLLTAERIVSTFEAETDHSDAAYAVTNASDLASSSPAFNPDCGLIWSGYRPSDDVTHYKYNIPGNMFACVTLERIASLLADDPRAADLVARASALAASVREAIETYGVYVDPVYGKIYVYETNGMTADPASSSGKLRMDAANVPSLLSAPWIGYCDNDDPVYLATRTFLLSEDNPYYFAGTYAQGVGDPHQLLSGAEAVWPMALALQGMTAQTEAEALQCLAWMRNSTSGTYVMHEAVDANDPSRYTRDFFTWPCALYAELYLETVLLPGSPA